MSEFTAWAIDTRSPEGHGLLGRYFFGYRNIPPSSEGCETALFKTRKIAREHRKRMATYSGDTWKPRVIRVKVTVCEV